MSKKQFQILVIFSYLLAIFAGLFDLIWPNPVADQALDYIIELEGEVSDAKAILFAVLVFLEIVFIIVCLVGLLKFKSWGRKLYLASFLLMLPLYPLMGIYVSSGLGQLFADVAMILSGVILALIYYSPVAKYFETTI